MAATAAGILWLLALRGGPPERWSRHVVLGAGVLSAAAALVTLRLSDDFLFATYRIDALSQAAKAVLALALALAAASAGSEALERPPLALFMVTAALALEALMSALDIVALVVLLAAALTSLVAAAALAPDSGGIRRPLRRLAGSALAPVAMMAAGAPLVLGALGEDALPLISEALVDYGPGPAAAAGAVLLVAGTLYVAGVMPWFSPLPMLVRDEWPPLAVFAASGVLVANSVLFTRLSAALGPMGWRLQAPLAAVAALGALAAAVRALNRSDARCAIAYVLCAEAAVHALGLVPATSRGASSTLAAALIVALANAVALAALAGRKYEGRALALADLAGLGRREPLQAAALTVAALALAGLPPAAGFVTRWRLIAATWTEGWIAPALAAVAASAVLALAAGALIVTLYGRGEPAPREPRARGGVLPVALAALLLLWGLVPGPLMRAADALAALLP